MHPRLTDRDIDMVDRIGLSLCQFIVVAPHIKRSAMTAADRSIGSQCSIP